MINCIISFVYFVLNIDNTQFHTSAPSAFSFDDHEQILSKIKIPNVIVLFAFQIVLSALTALAAASPSAIVPYAYHAGAPLGHDGRVVDTPEVAHAKAAHLAAHAHEAAKTAGYGYGSHGWAAAPAYAYGAPAYAYGSAYGYAAPVAHAYAAPALAYGHHYAHGAPLGHDGRVVDTPEVAHAKAAHLAAHAHEAAKTAGYGHAAHVYAAPAYGHGYGHGYGYGAPIGHDGRVVDTPEVAHAKAAHFAAHAEANAHAHYWETRNVE